MGRVRFGSRRRRLVIALSIVIWTSLAWGGRIGLLNDSDSIWDWVRIGGSGVVGLLVALALVASPGDRVTGGVVVLFVVWTTVLWTRSLAVNWTGDGSIAFKLVHTALAGGFFTLSWLAWKERRA